MTPKSAEVGVEAFVEGATEVAVLKGLQEKGLLSPVDLRAGGAEAAQRQAGCDRCAAPAGRCVGPAARGGA